MSPELASVNRPQQRVTAEAREETIVISKETSDEDSRDDDQSQSEDEWQDIEESVPQPNASRQSLREDPLRRTRTDGRKRKRRICNSSSASQEDLIDFPIPEISDPDKADPAGHLSIRDLPYSLTNGRLAGPGKGWLGLPVGLFTRDPFDFPEEWSLDQRLPYYRVVFANFTTSVTIRWNVGMINIHGDVPKTIKGNRVPAPSCATNHVSFFREHTVLGELKGKMVTVYLYTWMRTQWNMGTAMNLPNLRACIQDDYRLEARERRKKRLETNDYAIPLFRDDDFPGQRDPGGARARVVQDITSALVSIQSLPFNQCEIIGADIDEHRLQELFWNFSYFIDVLNSIKDRIQAEHGNTLFSTRSARAISRRAKGEVQTALARLVSNNLRGMKVPALEINRVGGATLFGQLPDDGNGDTYSLDIPDAGRKAGSYVPRGFDDYEAYVFQKLGEFSIHGKERFGCNEVISPDPSCPQDQRSWERPTPQVEEVRARMENRRLQEIERERTQRDMQTNPDEHRTRSGFWFAPVWDKRKAPPTPARRFQGEENNVPLKELAAQIGQALRQGTLGNADRDHLNQSRHTPEEDGTQAGSRDQIPTLPTDMAEVQNSPTIGSEEIAVTGAEDTPVVPARMHGSEADEDLRPESLLLPPCPTPRVQEQTGGDTGSLGDPGSGSLLLPPCPTPRVQEQTRGDTGSLGDPGSGPQRQTPNLMSSPGPVHDTDIPRDIRGRPSITPRKIKRSRLLALSPEQEMKRARFIVCRLDYYDLHYKLHISRSDNAHWIDDSEKRALAEEDARRQVTLEGFGYGRPEPTPRDQKKREADQMVLSMSTRWLQIHSEYIMQGSGAYNKYQREAVAQELQRRPAEVMVPSGMLLDEDEEDEE